MRDFFRRFYHPGNASLAIAGDIDTDEALRLTEAMFGEIPRGPRVGPRDRVGADAGGARIVLEDRVELPRLYLAWPTPALFSAATLRSICWATFWRTVGHRGL